MTEKEFEPPDHLSVDEQVSNAFGVSFEEPMDVVVRFTEEQAPYIWERTWHPSQEIEELEDGRVVHPASIARPPSRPIAFRRAASAVIRTILAKLIPSQKLSPCDAICRTS